MGDGFSQSYQYNVWKINRNIAYHEGRQVGDEYLFLREFADGEVMPAVWTNVNTTRRKIETVLGDKLTRAYTLKVQAINKDAQSKYLDYKYKMLALKDIKSDFEDLEASTGIPTVSQEQANIPEDGVEDYIKKSYKDITEVCMEAALKFIQKRFKLNFWELQCFRDLLVTGACFSENRMIEGIPRPERVDPRNIGFDGWATDDFLSDSSFYFVNRYEDLAKVRQIYNLSDTEYDEIKNMNSPIPTYGNQYSVNETGGYLAVNGINIGIYRVLPDKSKRVLTTKYYWSDTKVEKFVEIVDKKGQKHFKRVSDTKKNLSGDEVKIVERRIKTWRKCTLIAGKVVKEWGEVENQTRSIDNYADSTPPIQCLIPNYTDGTWTSLYDQIIPFINDICAAYYKIRVELAKHVGQVLEYDISALPDGWEHGDWLKALKRDGISFRQSVQKGFPSQVMSNGASQQEMGVSTSINQFLSLAAAYEATIDNITGIDKNMTGNSMASTLVGVQQQNIAQSKLSLESRFELFNQFRERVYNDLACKVKYAFTDRETFAPIIGDVGVNFMEQDIDILMNDYGVFCESIPELFTNKQQFQGLVTTAISQGVFNDPKAMENFYFALEMLAEPDVKDGMAMFAKVINKRNREAQMQQQAQEQAQMQQEQELQQQSMAAQKELQVGKYEGQSYVNNQNAQNKSTLQREKEQAKMNQIILENGLESTTNKR